MGNFNGNLIVALLTQVQVPEAVGAGRLRRGPLADGPLARFFWRALDGLDYWLTPAQLWLLDAVVRTRARNHADQWRAGDPRG